MKKQMAASSHGALAQTVVALAFAASLAGCASLGTGPEAASEPHASALACTLPSNCVNSLPDSDLAPLRFDGSAAQAMVALRATLVAFPAAKIVQAEDLAMEVVFTTQAGFQDRVDFRIDTSRQRVDYRSRSSFGHFDFGKNRSRMQAFAQRFEQRRPH